MTESYRNELPRGNQILTNIIIAVTAALLGGGVATFSWFAEGWFGNQLELVILQDTMKRVVKTNEELIVTIKDFSDRMEELENVGNQVPRLEEKTAVLEALSKNHEESIRKNEEKIKELSDRMHFYHEAGPDKERRTLEEWEAEYRRRQREREREQDNKRGKYQDEWDGIFRYQQ